MTDVVPNITRHEAKAIYDAMLALTAVAGRAGHESYNRLNTDCAELARLASFAEVASDSLFQVVNVASNHLAEPNAARVLKRWAKR